MKFKNAPCSNYLHALVGPSEKKRPFSKGRKQKNFLNFPG